MKSCPFGCSHHIFPNHFKFCPYCGTKLSISELDSTSIPQVNQLKNLKKIQKDFK